MPQPLLVDASQHGRKTNSSDLTAPCTCAGASRALQGALLPRVKRASQVLDADGEQARHLEALEGSKTDQRLVLCALADACTATSFLSLSSSECANLQAAGKEAAAGGVGSLFGSKARPKRGAPC